MYKNKSPMQDEWVSSISKKGSILDNEEEEVSNVFAEQRVRR